VFLTTWHEFPAVPESTIDWDALIALRQAVQRSLEKLREAGTIGAPLEAEVDVYCLADHAERYLTLGAELRFLTITAATRIHKVTSEPAGTAAAETGTAVIPGVWLRAQRSTGTKCVRCWHLTDDVGTHAEHPELCGRCVGNISGAPEVRHHV
jgi:isoleucyl-tRNA synthetase